MEFESLSGLQTSPKKSTLFCAGISDGTKVQLVDCLQIREGKLLVRYFGVSLISSRLNVANCATLLDKITHRMHSWLSKNLSFASRLQLISFVLYSIQVYWTSIFCLPKKVIHVVEQKFSRFLWNGKVDGVAKAKVSWKDLCVPKQEGGLGIKSLEVWNRASMMRHIWSLFARSDSIWVAWVKVNLLRGRSFWHVNIPQNCTWTWQKLLKMRDEADTSITFDVRDGQDI